MRDEAVAREARVAPRMQRRPADRLVVEVGEHTGRGILVAELAHPVGTRGTAQETFSLLPIR